MTGLDSVMSKLQSVFVTAGIGLVSLTLGCVSQPQIEARQHSVEYDFETQPLQYGDDFNWQCGGPVDFLERLKTTGMTYSVVGVHRGWVRDSDVPILMQKLDSKMSCVHVVSIKSSHLPTSSSTEGREAAFLLEGYRKGYYPPSLSSADFVPDNNEIRAWYQRWKGSQ